MPTTALLFGSIGTFVETSELQRQAFNQAFAVAGLSWIWGQDEYRELLKIQGGKNRIHHFANVRGERVDVNSIYANKTRIFNSLVRELGAEPRAGVIELLRHARAAGMATAFVTSTTPENIETVFTALRGRISWGDFDLVTDGNMVSRLKPDPEIYELALSTLKVSANNALAIEDTSGSAQAAISAGIRTIAFPGVNSADQDFSGCDLVTGRLDVDLLSDTNNQLPYQSTAIKQSDLAAH